MLIVKRDRGRRAFARSLGSITGRFEVKDGNRNHHRDRMKLAAVAAAVTLIATAGVAFAALPGAASATASAALAKHAVSIPGPHAHAGSHPDSHGISSQDPGPVSAGDAAGASKGKGSAVSQLATTTTVTGVAKGAEICTLASDGKCQAGQHGKSGDPHGKSGDPHGKAGQHGNAGAGA